MLTGQLVRLRRYEDADLDRVLAWMNDRDVTRWITVRYPVSRAEEQEWVERVIKRPPSEGVTLAIETLAEGRHIGSVGLGSWKPENRTAELGVAIGDKQFWSRGYGTDAILTLLRFGFDEMNLNRVSLTVLDGNDRAVACYVKCGFQNEGRLRQEWYQEGGYHDLLVMGVLREEFLALHGAKAQHVEQASAEVTP